jgi:addiction module RelE/StbE family toxin
MKIKAHKLFDKQYSKLRKNEQDRVKNAIKTYLASPKSRQLRIHELKGEWSGFSSMSAGGDIRIHFKIIDENTVLFMAALGSHSQLYK